VLAQFVVFRVEACEILNFLEMVLERTLARIQNRLSVLMQKQWGQNVVPEKMIVDKGVCRARLKLEFV
jgi:hypothetical protein